MQERLGDKDDSDVFTKKDPPFCTISISKLVLAIDETNKNRL